MKNKHWQEWHTSEMSDNELVNLLMPHTPFQKLDFWFFSHFELLHQWVWIFVDVIYCWDIETKERIWFFQSKYKEARNAKRKA